MKDADTGLPESLRSATEGAGKSNLVAPGLLLRLVVGALLPVPTCVLLILAVGVLNGVSAERLFEFGKLALMMGAMLGWLPCLCYTAAMERLHTLGVRRGAHLQASAGLGLLTGVLLWAPAHQAIAWFPAYGAATGLLVGLVLWRLRVPAQVRDRVRAPW